MRIDGSKLKRVAGETGMAPAQLAQVVSRTGLSVSTPKPGAPSEAERAVTNWMNGRDHPRCKASDIRKLADSMGVEPKDICSFVSRVVYHRGSTQKARLVADMIRGKSFRDADLILHFSPKRAAVNVRKCLLAAAAEAENAGAREQNLVVRTVMVDEAPQIKRFQPKDRGRAHKIIKQQSHITIGLEERS